MPGSASGSHSAPPQPVSEDELPVVLTARLGPKELTSWLQNRVRSLTEAWIHDLRARGMGSAPGISDIVERFAELLVRLLPLMLGPHRDQIAPIWDRTSELYGAIAAKRGLAAGEAIEELHLLRELVIRDLYRDPPLGGNVPLSLREILRLNRSLDRAATHASVGHTDSLFFEFFGSEGGKSLLSGHDVASEASIQLEQISSEVRSIVEHLVASSGASTEAEH
ncbi:MAG: hypothetical protein HOA23_17480 [Gemmatimonadales bacterium]|jgi:hypothetical protein|nr:hypothetical protein [Gemmatimonadales bacterium]